MSSGITFIRIRRRANLNNAQWKLFECAAQQPVPNTALAIAFTHRPF